MSLIDTLLCEVGVEYTHSEKIGNSDPTLRRQVYKAENKTWRVCETCRNSPQPGRVLKGYCRYVYVVECWHDYRMFKVRLSTGEVVEKSEFEFLDLLPEQRIRAVVEMMIRRRSITEEEFNQMKEDGYQELPAEQQIHNFLTATAGNSLENALLRLGRNNAHPFG